MLGTKMTGKQKKNVLMGRIILRLEPFPEITSLTKGEKTQ